MICTPTGSLSDVFVTGTTAAGFPEGPVATTQDSIYFGFGFEGITDEADRNEVMGRAIGYLLS